MATENENIASEFPTRKVLLTVAACTLCVWFVLIIFPIPINRPTVSASTNSSDIYVNYGSCPPQEHNTTKRIEFYPERCDVFGWPSGGGLLVKTVGGVELEHLGLDRFQASTRSLDQAEEDAFCEKLQLIGAKWWDHEQTLNNIRMSRPRQEDATKYHVRLETGWPATGGVWLWKSFGRTIGELAPLDLGQIHMAFNMEERCQVIEKLGGTFYQDPKDCLDLATWSKKPNKEEL